MLKDRWVDPYGPYATQRVHVPNNRVLGIWVRVIIVQVLGKYMGKGFGFGA